MTTLHFCELRPDHYDRAAELHNRHSTEIITAEVWSQRMLERHEDGTKNFVRVVEDEGRLIAFGVARLMPDSPKRTFAVRCVVDESHQFRGLGGKLFQESEIYALDHGSEWLRCFVKDDNDLTLGFMERRGYQRRQHLQANVLTMSTVDWQKVDQWSVAEGFTIRSLASWGDSEANRRALFQAANTYDADTPMVEDWGVYLNFESYERDILNDPSFRAEGTFLAFEGDQIVGVHTIGYLSGETEFTTSFCGVDRRFRGRGIARSLKAAGLRYAQSHGAEKVITHNDSNNVPMLHINQSMGFEIQPGYIILRKEVMP